MKAYQIGVLIVFSCILFLDMQAMQQAPRPVPNVLQYEYTMRQQGLYGINDKSAKLLELLINPNYVTAERISALIAQGAFRNARADRSLDWGSRPLIALGLYYLMPDAQPPFRNSIEETFPEWGKTSLHIAVDNYTNPKGNMPWEIIHLDVIKALLEDGHDLQSLDITAADLINAPDPRGASVLHIAQDIRLLQLLLEKGGNINVKDENGSTPLHGAMKKNVRDKVLFLLQMGADRTIKNKDMRTPVEIGDNQELKWKVVAYTSGQELQHFIPGIMAFQRALIQSGAAKGEAKDIGKIVANKLVEDLVNQKMALARRTLPEANPENLKIGLRKEIIESLRKMPMQEPAPGEASVSWWLRWLLGHVEY